MLLRESRKVRMRKEKKHLGVNVNCALFGSQDIKVEDVAVVRALVCLWCGPFSRACWVGRHGPAVSSDLRIGRFVSTGPDTKICGDEHASEEKLRVKLRMSTHPAIDWCAGCIQT